MGYFFLDTLFKARRVPEKLTLNASFCDSITGGYAVSGVVGEDVQV